MVTTLHLLWQHCRGYIGGASAWCEDGCEFASQLNNTKAKPLKLVLAASMRQVSCIVKEPDDSIQNDLHLSEFVLASLSLLGASVD